MLQRRSGTLKPVWPGVSCLGERSAGLLAIAVLRLRQRQSFACGPRSTPRFSVISGMARRDCVEGDHGVHSAQSRVVASRMCCTSTTRRATLCTTRHHHFNRRQLQSLGCVPTARHLSMVVSHLWIVWRGRGVHQAQRGVLASKMCSQSSMSPRHFLRCAMVLCADTSRPI